MYMGQPPHTVTVWAKPKEPWQPLNGLQSSGPAHWESNPGSLPLQGPPSPYLGSNLSAQAAQWAHNPKV